MATLAQAVCWFNTHTHTQTHWFLQRSFCMITAAFDGFFRVTAAATAPSHPSINVEGESQWGERKITTPFYTSAASVES